MPTKQEDVHTHEVVLPSGEAVMTGPPIGETHDEMVVVAAEPILPKRAPITKAAAPNPPAPEDDPAETRAAWEARDPDRLPKRAREVYDRMSSSFLRFVDYRKRTGGGALSRTGRPLESYADQIGWRGVVQAYSLAPTKRTTPRLQLVKSVSARLVSETRGGFHFVPMTANWRDPGSHYDRVFERPVPGSGGARVQIGRSGPNARLNLIGVFVPVEAVGSGDLGQVAAVDWVTRNLEYIGDVALADIDHATATREILPGLKRATGFKFVARAQDASERTSYGAVYVPWEIDLQGQYATADEIRKMAHRFVASGGISKVMHWQTGTKAGEPVGKVVESWIEKRHGDKDYPFGTWGAAVQWHPEVWPRVESGELGGFSMGGDWTVVPILAAA